MQHIEPPSTRSDSGRQHRAPHVDRRSRPEPRTGRGHAVPAVMDTVRKAEILAAYEVRSAHFATIGARKRGVFTTSVAPSSPSRALSGRELEVMALVGEGDTNREIGQKLFITEETVKTHMANVLRALNARNRAHALSIANRCGLLATPAEPAV